jgi:glycosyltransferase involved in cell wall biosynthesis
LSGAREPGLVVYQDTGGIDAIDEYSRRLVDALCAGGTPTRYSAAGARSLSRTRSQVPWVLLQYNPLSYGRFGFAPLLIPRAVALRQRTGTRFVVSVHEPWVEIEDWRSALTGGYQRIQLPALLAVADAVITMTESLARTLGRGAVPIALGSTVTPVPEDGVSARAHLQLHDRFVVALFGRAHPSRLLDYAEHAIGKLADTAVGARLTVLNIGDRAPELAVPPQVDVRTMGHLEPPALSRALRASHILLLPFSDGVSARRTTLMAGLAHGVPVIGLRGHATDTVLARSDALVLTEVGNRDAFAQAVTALAADDAALCALGDAGRRLYVEHFDWPVVARRVRDVVSGPPRLRRHALARSASRPVRDLPASRSEPPTTHRGRRRSTSS